MCDRDCDRCMNAECIVDEQNYQRYCRTTPTKKKKKSIIIFTDWESKKYVEENYERQIEF